MTTEVPIRDYVDARLTDLRDLLERHITDAATALEIADGAMQRRLDLLNEFRAQASDQQAHYLRIEDYNGRHIALQERITRVEEAGLAGRRVQTTYFTAASILVALLAVAVSLVVHYV